MSRVVRLAIGLLLGSALGLAQDAGKRAPVPNAQSQKDAEALIKGVFKEEYARKTPDGQAALARKLLLQARETKDDPVSRYVLFREAADVASKAGDFLRTLEAAEATAELYEVDRISLQAQTLIDGAAQVKSSESAKSFAETCLKVAEGAAAADRFDEAKGLCAKAEVAAKSAKDLNLVTRVQKQKKDLEGLAADSQKVKAAEATLQNSPEDPAGNLALGKFLLAKGASERALNHLVKGSDPALKAAAEKDLAAPKEVQAQIQLGHAWWDLSEKEKEGPFRKALQDRARTWYETAWSGATGLARAAIEKRLDALDKVGGAGPQTPPTLRVVSYAEFEAMSSRFPQSQDLAAKSGKATASSFYPDRAPDNVFKGQRRSNAWTLDNASGWFEAKWDLSVRGRVLLMVGRNSEPRFDSWGQATVTLNGSIKLPVKDMSGSKVILVELGTAGRLQSVRVDIAGAELPGLATVEVYR